MIELLKNLIGFLKSSKKKVKLVGRSHDQPDKLYYELKKDRLLNRGELLNKMFGDNKHRSIYFSQIQQKLLERLINSILSVQPMEISSKSGEVYIRAYKYFAVVQILQAKSQRSIMINLAERTFKMVLEYQFTELIIMLARGLRYQYSSLEGSQKKYEYYQSILDEYWPILLAEDKAEAYYCRLQNRFTWSKSVNMEMYETSQKYADELQLLQNTIKSYRFNLFAFNVRISNHQIKQQNKSIIETAQEAIFFFKELNYPTPYTTIFSFIYKVLPLQIIAGEHEKATKTIQEAIELVPVGSHNWIIVNYYEAVLGLYSMNYNLIEKVLKRISPHLHTTAPGIKEQFQVVEAYWKWIQELENPSRKFKTGKFFNKMKIYEKDKKGININIQILKFLFYFSRRQYGKIIDNEDSLKMYAHNWLRGEKMIRNRLFFKLLLVIVRERFQKKAIIKKVTSLLEQLSSKTPLDIDIEIFPYEQLWNIIITQLD